MDKATAALAKDARENPFLYFTHEQTRDLFGFGEKFLRSLLKINGAPVLANKINPAHFQQWLWENREAISKLAE